MAYANSNRIITIASFSGSGGTSVGNINIIGSDEPAYRPNGGDLVVGDTWFDGDTQYVWNGTEWIQVSPDVPPTIFAPSEPMRRPDGSSLRTGDRWYNTTNNSEYIFHVFEEVPEEAQMVEETELTINTEEYLIIVVDKLHGEWLPL